MPCHVPEMSTWHVPVCQTSCAQHVTYCSVAVMLFAAAYALQAAAQKSHAPEPTHFSIVMFLTSCGCGTTGSGE